MKTIFFEIHLFTVFTVLLCDICTNAVCTYVRSRILRAFFAASSSPVFWWHTDVQWSVSLVNIMAQSTGSHRGAATPLRVSRLAGARLRGPTPVLAPRFTAVFLVVDFHIQPLLLNFLNVLACPAAAFAAVTWDICSYNIRTVTTRYHWFDRHRPLHRLLQFSVWCRLSLAFTVCSYLSHFLDEQTFYSVFLLWVCVCLCVFNQVKLLISGATVGISLVMLFSQFQSISKRWILCASTKVHFPAECFLYLEQVLFSVSNMLWLTLAFTYSIYNVSIWCS